MKITFDEINHKYTVDGQEAISVTQLLKATGLSKDFDNEDEIVKEKVKKASERGNYYDELASSAVDDPFELDEWQERLLEFVHEKGLELRSSQNRYGALKPFAIAGTGDFEGRTIETNNFAIIDLKATHVIYLNSVTWQVNIYTYLKDPKNYETFDKYVLHYNEKDDRFTLIKLETIPKEKILNLFECYQLGEMYEENVALTNVIDLKLFSATFNKIKEYEKYLKEEKEKLDEFYGEIKKHMAANHIKTFDIEDFKITYTPTGTKRIVDYVKLAERKNLEKLKELNEFLKQQGKEEYKLITVKEVTAAITEEEKDKYAKISNVSDKLTVTPKKK